MATRYFCDLCDQRIQIDADVFQVRIGKTQVESYGSATIYVDETSLVPLGDSWVKLVQNNEMVCKKCAEKIALVIHDIEQHKG